MKKLKMSAGETAAQVTAEPRGASHIGVKELLIFLDYFGEIKGAIKGRDEIRQAALHRRRTKHL